MSLEKLSTRITEALKSANKTTPEEYLKECTDAIFRSMCADLGIPYSVLFGVGPTKHCGDCSDYSLLSQRCAHAMGERAPDNVCDRE